MTEEQKQKLPKWAQQHIADIERRLFVAVRKMNEMADNQTVSPIYFDDFVCVGEGGPMTIRQYVQSRKIVVNAVGVECEVLIREEQKCIDIGWASASESTLQEVSMIPASFQKIRLKTAANLRA